MIVRFHFEWPDGTEDYITLEGDTIEDVKSRADVELDYRHARERWSEVIGD